MDLNTSKNLGGIGALLMFISVLPYVNTYGIITLVGLILILIGAKGLADYYQEGGIFNNALYGVILSIVGVVAFAAVFIYALVGFFTDLGFASFGIADFASFATSLTTLDPTVLLNTMLNWVGYILVAAVVLFIFIVIAAVFYRKSMSLTAKKTGVRLFGTSGMVLLIGAVLTIIIVGIFLMWISLLLIAIAFFQIRAQPAQAAAPPPPPQM